MPNTFLRAFFRLPQNCTTGFLLVCLQNHMGGTLKKLNHTRNPQLKTISPDTSKHLLYMKQANYIFLGFGPFFLQTEIEFVSKTKQHFFDVVTDLLLGWRGYPSKVPCEKSYEGARLMQESKQQIAPYSRRSFTPLAKASGHVFFLSPKAGARPRELKRLEKELQARSGGGWLVASRGGVLPSPKTREKDAGGPGKPS